MYLTFELQRNENTPTSQGDEHHDPLSRRAPSPPIVAPHLTHKCTTYEVNVEDTPRSTRGKGKREEHTWIAQDEPIKSLTNGHIITLKSRGNVICSGRISVITDITKHWVTMLLTGGPRRANLRAPIPWCHLTKLDRFAHTIHYANLPDNPPPHDVFAERPDFTNPHDNPYEFDLDPRETQGLYEKLGRNQRLTGILNRSKESM
ncbi:uncharacterized protein C8Q71DRAFT_727474 [Rhodofomes roseus]|uniref:Uncharacterized protein n=1 Tax=Rhodofomes roseus TaxID=34475 RepID=A0A4Y9YKY0_9APHY|nr:uncharacterized protein C8Q71DRAFT_727474 [Rhodofomes roseus]KAH9830492.1 hypothetical protein C8Q71DRAFT_727474 [Rhodofomes roseus]TFY62600.1 hypothetical protein EVJ58_g3760 [Rhodofomes roseus]